MGRRDLKHRGADIGGHDQQGQDERSARGPVFYGPVGISAATMWRINVASGQAAEKARRTRDAISITRAPSFKSLRRMVFNSAVATPFAFLIASRTVTMSQ